jgi:hypothetical protein
MFRAPVEGEGGREGEAAGAAAGPVPEAEGGPRIEREKAPPRPIEGLGQEAFWVSNRASGVLYVLRGHAYLRLSVGGPDTEEAKLKKAIALARKALPRL